MQKEDQKKTSEIYFQRHGGGKSMCTGKKKTHSINGVNIGSNQRQKKTTNQTGKNRQQVSHSERQLYGRDMLHHTQTESQDSHYVYTEEPVIQSLTAVYNATQTETIQQADTLISAQTCKTGKQTLCIPDQLILKVAQSGRRQLGLAIREKCGLRTAPIYPCNINISKLFFWEFIV